MASSSRRVDAWATAYFANRKTSEDRDSVDHACRQLVGELGRAGWTRYSVPGAHGHSVATRPDPRIRRAPRVHGQRIRPLRQLARSHFRRTLPPHCIRETLARHDALADFAFAMQGLGSGAISLAGSPDIKARYLPRVASGEAIAAFALSEATAGSDVAAIKCRARREGDSYVLDGEKTWISNGGIAEFYCVFARTSDAEVRADGTVAARGISAFVVDADAPGFPSPGVST